MKNYTPDQKANHVLDYNEWCIENNSDNGKKLPIEKFTESRGLARTTFTGWIDNAKVKARAAEIKKDRQGQQKKNQQDQQKQIITRLIAKHESLEIKNNELITENAEIQTKYQELEVQKMDMSAEFDAMKAELENRQIEITARNQEIANLNEKLQLEVEKSEGCLVEGKQLEAPANGVVKQLEGENERLRVEIVELTEAKRVSLNDKDIAANESQMKSGVIEDLEEKLRTAEELLKASDDRLCESTKQTGHCDRNELLSRIEDANIKIDQIQSESDTQITVLQEQLADSKIQLEKAEKAIKSAVHERDTNIQENRVKIEELEATLVEHMESFEILINSYSELETDNEQMNSELQKYIQQFDKQLFLNELKCEYDQLKTRTGEKSVSKIRLETMIEKAKIENQTLVDQLVALSGLKNEVDESNMLEHAEKELEGLKSEGSDQNEYIVKLKTEKNSVKADVIDDVSTEDEKRSVLFEQELLSFKSDCSTNSKQVLERGNLLKAGLAAAKSGKNGEKSEQNEKSKISEEKPEIKSENKHIHFNESVKVKTFKKPENQAVYELQKAVNDIKEAESQSSAESPSEITETPLQALSSEKSTAPKLPKNTNNTQNCESSGRATIDVVREKIESVEKDIIDIEKQLEKAKAMIITMNNQGLGDSPVVENLKNNVASLTVLRQRMLDSYFHLIKLEQFSQEVEKKDQVRSKRQERVKKANIKWEVEIGNNEVEAAGKIENTEKSGIASNISENAEKAENTKKSTRSLNAPVAAAITPAVEKKNWFRWRKNH